MSKKHFCLRPGHVVRQNFKAPCSIFIKINRPAHYIPTVCSVSAVRKKQVSVRISLLKPRERIFNICSVNRGSYRNLMSTESAEIWFDSHFRYHQENTCFRKKTPIRTDRLKQPREVKLMTRTPSKAHYYNRNSVFVPRTLSSWRVPKWALWELRLCLTRGKWAIIADGDGVWVSRTTDSHKAKVIIFRNFWNNSLENIR